MTAPVYAFERNGGDSRRGFAATGSDTQSSGRVTALLRGESPVLEDVAQYSADDELGDFFEMLAADLFGGIEFGERMPDTVFIP